MARSAGTAGRCGAGSEQGHVLGAAAAPAGSRGNRYRTPRSLLAPDAAADAASSKAAKTGDPTAASIAGRTGGGRVSHRSARSLASHWSVTGRSLAPLSWVTGAGQRGYFRVTVRQHAPVGRVTRAR